MFVQVDDGKQFAVVIPEGLSPGDEFEVEEPDWSAGEQQGAVASPQNTAAATSASEDNELPAGWSAHVSSAGERCAIVTTYTYRQQPANPLTKASVKRLHTCFSH